MERRPLILISNDDGYMARGINFLADIACQYGDVIVVAPDGPRSGSAQAVTFNSTVTCRLISEKPGLKIYACNGTPCDCVKMGLANICPRTPDLVLGGINHGDNSAVNVHYSGTMGIVMEGCMKEVPSIGFSHCSHSADTDFTPMRPYIEKVMEYVLANKLPKGVCLNVNAPEQLPYKGMKICRMGQGIWQKEWDRRISPRGFEYYWLVGEFNSQDTPADESDYVQLRQGYVTVTPVKIDITDYATIEQLKNNLEL